jgi:hypothetical protein
MKNEVMIKTKSKREKISKVRNLILSAGKKIGSVHFIKKNGKVRKMTYRVYMNKAQYAPSFTSKKVKTLLEHDKQKVSMTIFDTNKIVYNKQGKISGRGAWRSIPLETVFRIKANGVVTKFV